MDRLSFSTNWNNKLHCDYFTTIRLCSRKYQKGTRFEIYLKDEMIATCEVVDVKACYARQLTDYVTYLDTGYNADETRKLLSTMYKKFDIDMDTQLFLIVILKRIK